MAVIPPGRKQFNINKNLESGLGVYQSEFYSKTRFSPDLQLEQRKLNTDLDQILSLRSRLSAKEQELEKLKRTIQHPISNVQVNPVYPELVISSAYNSKQCVEIYEDHFKYLSQQMKEKELRKIEDSLTRQKETQERLQEMCYLRDLEALERKKMLDKAQEYRNSLIMQQSFNREINRERMARSVTPRGLGKELRKSFVNARSVLNPTERVPVITKDQVSPETKNLNRVAVELSGLKAFQQPQYTKNAPKVQPSYPVIGSNRNSEWGWRRN